MRLRVRPLTGVRLSRAHRGGPGRGALLLPRSIKPGATIASAAPRPLSLRLKLLAICEKLHNLGIYSYGSGERFFMLREPDDNTLSITRVRASRAPCRRPIHYGSTIGPWHGIHLFRPACPTWRRLPRPPFTAANISCNFCGLQEIRLAAISLLMRDSLCFTHGPGSASASRPQTQVAGRRWPVRCPYTFALLRGGFPQRFYGAAPAAPSFGAARHGRTRAGARSRRARR